jgi:hypothetical protein
MLGSICGAQVEKLKNSLVFIALALYLTTQFPKQAIAGGNGKAPAGSSQSPSQKQAPGQAVGDFAKGVVRGQPFDAKFVVYDSTRLVFKSAPQIHTTSVRDYNVVTRSDVFTGIGLIFSTPQRFQGEYYTSNTGELVSDTQTQPRPQLVRYTTINETFTDWRNSAPYSMKLKFFKPVNGMLPGYVDLAVTDGIEHTHVKGFFYAVQKPSAL